VGDTAISTQRVVLVLADISGYTRFARLHRLSQAHAESIICELLDAVIMNTEHPLKLNELLGDAAFFYAPSDGTAAAAHSVFDQVTRFREAFHKRALELTGECSMCVCEACRNAGTLRLKVIVHEGEAVITHLRGFEKIAGEDVILAHRLLKNSIPVQEYVAVTAHFLRLLGDHGGAPAEMRRERCDGIGDVSVAVFHTPREHERPVARRGLAAVRTALRMDMYAAGRILFKTRPRRPRRPMQADPPLVRTKRG
jgi:class 3 adenylate cyclase